MSWLIKNNSEVPKKAEKRPSTCPAARPARTSSFTSKPAAEAMSQDDAVVRQVFRFSAVASAACSTAL